MSETQKYLSGNQETLQKVEKSKSQNGGSTNLSQGSNEVDQEFKVQKGEKFEFINEKSNDWPQWSIESKAKQAVVQNPQTEQDKKKQVEALQKLQREIQYQNDWMFSRGMSRPLRKKRLEEQQQIKKQAQQKKAKQSFTQGVIDKVKGWFK